MIALLDTNVLLRYSNPSDPAHCIVADAIRILRSTGVQPRIVPQNVYEFWVVGTRPIANNGLGLNVAECEQTLNQVEIAFPLLSDKEDLLVEWRKLVITLDCKGKVAHDARLVAAMKTHGVDKLLTFNVGDFSRYSNITILDPHVVASTVP